MAIAGSGGWKPSRKVRLENGHLVWGTHTQNKPPEIVVMDMEQAADYMIRNPGRDVNIHFYGKNSIVLAKKVREKLDG